MIFQTKQTTEGRQPGKNTNILFGHGKTHEQSLKNTVDFRTDHCFAELPDPCCMVINVRA
jgi:hypothetical protein